MRFRNGFTVFKMAILQDVLLQCGQNNDIFKNSDGFNLDISVSIDRDNAVLHVIKVITFVIDFGL